MNPPSLTPSLLSRQLAGAGAAAGGRAAERPAAVRRAQTASTPRQISCGCKLEPRASLLLLCTLAASDYSIYLFKWMRVRGSERYAADPVWPLFTCNSHLSLFLSFFSFFL